MSAIVNPWTRISNKAKVDIVTYALAPVAFAFGGLFVALAFKTTTLHQTRTIHVTPVAAVGAMSGRALVAALGTPSKSQTTNGVTCNLYAGKQIEVCFKG